MIKHGLLATVLLAALGMYTLGDHGGAGARRAQAVADDAGARGASARERGDATWVLHYRPDVVGRTIYGELLRALPASDRVVIVAANEKDRLDAQRSWPRRGTRLTTVGDGLTPWARDRYTCFLREGSATCVARPGGALPAAQQGDGRVPDRLVGMGLVPAVVRDARAPIGGDTILTDGHALVGQHSFEQARRAARSTRGGERELVLSLGYLFGRPAVVVPTHALGIGKLHLDMFVAHAGGKRLVVGDPTLATAVFERGTWFHPNYGRFDRARNVRIARGADEVAQALGRFGFEVHRVPMLVSEAGPGGRPPVVLTWTNAVTRRRTVYLPSYGLEALDRRACAVWEKLGFRCTPIRCGESIVAGGAVRCVLGRIR